MDLKKLLVDFQTGKISLDEILKHFKSLPFENLEFAHVDHHRQTRQGFPEVIYCEGKTDEQIEKIISAIMKKDSTVLATRAHKKLFDKSSSPTSRIAVPCSAAFSVGGSGTCAAQAVSSSAEDDATMPPRITSLILMVHLQSSLQMISAGSTANAEQAWNGKPDEGQRVEREPGTLAL